MARRRKARDEGSLDSLLDTMTNVVGILIVLMAMTQIGVGDAVRRIFRETDAPLADYTEEAVNAKRDEQAELEKVLKAVRFQWEELNATVTGNQASLKKIRQVTDDLRRQLKDPPKDHVSRDEMADIITDRTKESDDLRAKVLKAEAELQKLKAMDATLPQFRDDPAKVVTLPNPRPAPAGYEPMVFFCRDGRVYHVDEQNLQLIAESGVDRAGPSTNAKGQLDCRAIVDFFAKRSLGDKNFRLRAEVHNFAPFLVLERRPDAGETTDRIQDHDSDFQAKLLLAIRTHRYIRFRVWPDSFETYVIARNIVDKFGKEGIPAGWEPQTRSDEWKIRLAGNAVCIGKPVTDRTPEKPVTDGPPGPDEPPIDEPPPGDRRPPPSDEVD